MSVEVLLWVVSFSESFTYFPIIFILQQQQQTFILRFFSDHFSENLGWDKIWMYLSHHLYSEILTEALKNQWETGRHIWDIRTCKVQEAVWSKCCRVLRRKKINKSSMKDINHRKHGVVIQAFQYLPWQWFRR